MVIECFWFKKTHWQKKFKITNQKKVKNFQPSFFCHTHTHTTTQYKKQQEFNNLFARIYSFSSRERLWYFETNNNLLYYVTTDTTYWDIKTSTHTNKTLLLLSWFWHTNFDCSTKAQHRSLISTYCHIFPSSKKQNMRKCELSQALSINGWIVKNATYKTPTLHINTHTPYRPLSTPTHHHQRLQL